MTTRKKLVCFVKYNVFLSKFYVEEYVNGNILTVMQKSCGFVEICVILCMFVCMSKINYAVEML